MQHTQNKETLPTRSGMELERYIPRTTRKILLCGDHAPMLAKKLRLRHACPEITGVLNDVEHQADCEHFHEVCYEPVESLAATEATYDCIVIDGLMHRLRNPQATLTNLIPLLHPGGLMIITAPNVQYHQRFMMLAQGCWRYDTDETKISLPPRSQIRYYTAYDLALLAKDAGLTEVKCNALRSDPPEAFPLDAEGYHQRGNIRIGPLSSVEYQNWLIYELVLFGMRIAG